MRRYAHELHAALVAAGGSRTFTLEQPAGRRYLSRLVDAGVLRRVDSAWSRYVGYPRSLRRRRADAFHVLDHSDAQIVRYLDPARTVVTCHDLIPLLAAEGAIPVRVPSTVARTFRWRVGHLARVHAVIAVSQATKATLERLTAVPPERITVVPQGVSPLFRAMPGARSAARASAGIPDTAPVVLQMASGGRYKNTPTLLRAFARLRARLGPRVALVRIGSPFYHDEADLASRLGLSEAVRYLGPVDDETLVAWYNAADVLIFPSWWEGFGWPPLEAMACGTPVVASSTPAVAEAVGDAGLLVPPEDADAMADAAERVLTDEACAAALRRRGLERAGGYTWARAAKGTLAVYDAIVRDLL